MNKIIHITLTIFLYFFIRLCLIFYFFNFDSEFINTKFFIYIEAIYLVLFSVIYLFFKKNIITTPLMLIFFEYILRFFNSKLYDQNLNILSGLDKFIAFNKINGLYYIILLSIVVFIIVFSLFIRKWFQIIKTK